MKFFLIIATGYILTILPTANTFGANFYLNSLKEISGFVSKPKNENSIINPDINICYNKPLKSSTFNVDSLSVFLKLQTLAFNIDSLDTVIFDLSKAMLVGNFIEFPVTFHADDYVYALDFSLKYNNQNIEFDSLINLTNGLNYLYYMNPNDSTLRFTSYRLGQMQNDSAVVKLRFTTLNGSVCINDLNTITGYLNGDQCSYKVTDCDTTSTFIENIQDESSVSIYPNPASQFINLKISDNYVLQITDATGNSVLNLENRGQSDEVPIDISFLSNGIYFLRITTRTFSFSEKLMIQH